MRTSFGFALLSGLALSASPGCSEAPASTPKASIVAAPARTTLLRTDAGDAPNPKNPYEGIGDAEFRSMAERADRLLVPAARLGGRALDALKATEERTRAIIRLEQYRLELTPDGERKLLDLARRIGEQHPSGSLSRASVDHPDGFSRTVHDPARTAWVEADKLLRSKLRSGTPVSREVRAAVGAFDASMPEAATQPAMPDLETKLIRLELRGDDLLPYLFRIHDLAADVERHRAKDAGLRAMIHAFASPLDRATLLHRMHRVQPGPDASGGEIELDLAEVDRALRIKGRFFPWLKPLTDEECRRMLVMMDAGKGLKDPKVVREAQDQSRLIQVLGSKEWLAFVRDELTPFVHGRELARLNRLAAISSESDRAAIDVLRRAQATLDELGLLFAALIPQFDHAFRPVLTPAGATPLGPIDLTGLKTADYVGEIRCTIEAGATLRLVYTHSLDAPTSSDVSPTP